MEMKEENDAIWSVVLKPILFGQWMYKIKNGYVQKHQPTLYCLDRGPKRSFVFEELQPIPVLVPSTLIF